MKEEFLKSYNPKMVEEKIYDSWVKNGCFKQSKDKNKKAFSVVMPPPNVTGRLHMGHALDNTIQDVLVRYKRMQGFNTLWIPGTDHSALSTECKVVNMLREQGIRKEDLSREEFLKHAFAWKEKYGNIIVNQVKRLGVSTDWDKIKFTMDPSCSEAVRKVFVDLYKEGLIYKGKRIINWCPNCKTSLSDIEVDFCEQSGKLWYIKYYLEDGSDYITVATTRPETLLGDVAVAVYPDDERYKKFIGKKVLVPIVNRRVPVLTDSFVEKDYGTGAVKVTPAHDINDFEVGERHNLDIISVISKKGTMLENTGKFAGLNLKEARREILKDLDEKRLILKVEDITHNVGKCYRCCTDVELLISNQWFAKMESLAKSAIDCLNPEHLKGYFKDKTETEDPSVDFNEKSFSKGNKDFLTFFPERFSKIYINWLSNIRDWCISRQIWWGHRIPAFYCKDCGEVTVSEKDLECCARCRSKNIYQDEDTLDTWFSSGLWPFSVFDWPEKTPDYNTFFPTSVLVTGYDIIFFWVARMVMLSLKFTGKVPFSDVLIHGLVRDSQGRKMSKSLGNGIDPLDIIEKFGADALRFMLILGSTLGNDIRFSEEKLIASRNFVNKIYNSARYIYLKVSENLESLDCKSIPKKLYQEDLWILKKLNLVIKEVTNNLDNFEFGVALFKIYEFFWDDFCDWYIELSKIRLDDNASKGTNCGNTKQILVFVFLNILKLFHPFTPFITENLWQRFTENKSGFLMLSKFPEAFDSADDSECANNIDIVIDIIKAIRKRRKDLNVPAGKILKEIFIETNNPEKIESCLVFVKRLARISKVNLEKSFCLDRNRGQFNTIIVGNMKVFIENTELFNKEEEILKLNKELKEAEEELEKALNQLKNEGFLSKAPRNVVEKIKSTKEDLLVKIEKIKESILNLQ